MKKQTNKSKGELNLERCLFDKPPLPREDLSQLISTITLPLVLIGNDGFTNRQSYLGDASMLMSASTFERSDLTADRELLTTLYRNCSIAKRIIDMPSEEMTRSGYTLSSSQVSEADLCKLKELEAKHNIKQEITNAIRWGRLYGGAIAVIIIKGMEAYMDQPLDPEIVPYGSFKGLLVVDLTQGITPSFELEDDVEDPDFGYPKYYEISMDTDGGTKTVKIHHSWVLRFTGRELPWTETIRNNYWGASELEHSWDEIRRYFSTCGNIAQLIFMANLITLKMGNFGSDLTYGSERMQQSIEKAVEHENRMRTSYGVQVMNATDSMETHPYNFAGITAVKESYMMDIAGAAEIPAAILFGRSPQGMNATGEADIRNYYDKISQLQERILRPVLEKLLLVMAFSCWGFAPDDLKITFNPVMTISPAERAQLSRESTEEIIAAVNAGLLTREEGRAELIRRGNALGNWGGLT